MDERDVLVKQGFSWESLLQMPVYERKYYLYLWEKRLNASN